MKSDIELKKDVEAELQWDPQINAATVGVEVKDGIVTLEGKVRSYAEKFAAERAAQRIQGVKGIALELHVSVPGSSRRDDADIAKAARDALHWNSLVPDERIKVLVEDGFVTLSGEVEWLYEKTASEAAVRPLTAVRAVINNIVVKPKAKPENVKEKIEAALRRMAESEIKNVQVSVDGGKVTLDGRVHSYHERQLVEGAAWAAPGVFSVVDHLRIG